MPRAVRTRTQSDVDVRLLRALADPTRQEILRLLAGGEVRAGDIAKAFRSRRPTISKHLRVLRDVGLIEARASGRERYYRVAAGPLRDAVQRMRSVEDMMRESLRRLGEHLG